MKVARLLVVTAFVYACLSLAIAQQVNASAQQNASASAAGVNASQSGNANANATVNRGHADAGTSSNANGSVVAGGASGNASSSNAADMRQVSGQLVNKLDTKTAKAGDEVVLKTNEKIKTADGIVIPKGSRLIGHVTEAKAHSKEEAESHLGLEFDRVELRGGQSMAIHSLIESVSPNANAVAGTSMADEEAFDAPMGGGAVAGRGVGAGRAGSGLVGGAAGGAAMATSRVGSGIGSTAGEATHATGAMSGAAAANVGRGVNGAAEGAAFAGTHSTGIPGVMLSGDAASSASGTLTAADRNIHLDSGTQMVLGIAAAR